MQSMKTTIHLNFSSHLCNFEMNSSGFEKSSVNAFNCSSGKFHHSLSCNFLQVSSSNLFLIHFAGTPAQISYAPTFFVKTAPAAIIDPSEIFSQLGSIVTLSAIQTSFPIFK